LISRIHSKLGTAGFIVAIVALVAALGGGAYAAQQGLNSKQKNQVKSIAKGLVPTGPVGPQGPAGAAGAAGAKGDKGDKGDTGPEGPQGPKGATGSPGAPGAPGPEGSPWTAGGTLPSGETETGVWGGVLNFTASEVKRVENASFNIPLESAPTVNLIQKDGTANPGNLTNCPGSAATPEAKPGNFCAYAITFAEDEEGYGLGGGTSSTLRATPFGIIFQSNVPGFAALAGTWAVTAP
jgi:hypothetical protein